MHIFNDGDGDAALEAATTIKQRQRTTAWHTHALGERGLQHYSESDYGRQAVRQALLPFDLCKSSSVPSFFMMMAPVQCSLCSQCSRGCYTACYCLTRAPPPDPCPTNLEMNIALTDVSIYIHSVYLLYMCPICALSCFFFELVTLL